MAMGQSGGVEKINQTKVNRAYACPGRRATT